MTNKKNLNKRSFVHFIKNQNDNKVKYKKRN